MPDSRRIFRMAAVRIACRPDKVRQIGAAGWGLLVRSALIIGGTGSIGRAVGRRLLSAGWQVTVTGRDPRRMPADLAAAGVELVLLDRDDPAGLAAAVGDERDLLVDCACYA